MSSMNVTSSPQGWGRLTMRRSRRTLPVTAEDRVTMTTQHTLNGNMECTCLVICSCIASVFVSENSARRQQLK